MRLGIVGSEEDRWTPKMVASACRAIREICERYGATAIISGDCPRGGVDRWAAEHAAFAGLQLIEYRPKRFAWDGPGGYKARNLDIARVSDRVVAIAPQLYGKWKDCYHCPAERGLPRHVVNGGCWTARKCNRFSIAVVQANGLYQLFEAPWQATLPT